MSDKITSNSLVVYCTILTLGIAVSFSSFKALAFAVVLFVLAQLLTIRFGFWGRLIVAYLLTMVTVGAFAALAWLIHLDLSATLVLVALCALLVVLVLWRRNTLPRILPARGDLLNPDDLVALCISLVFFFVLIKPLFPQPTAGVLGPIIMWGGDNSSHMKIIKVNDLNKGYAIGYENKVNLNGVLATYPQGWHVGAAFQKWMIDPQYKIHATPMRFLTFYYVLCALWFSFFVFLFIRLALFLRNYISKGKFFGIMWARLLVAGVCSAAIVGWIMTLFGYGFQTQLAALSFLLLEIIAIMHAYDTTVPRTRFKWFLFAGIAVAGSSFAWLFLLPVELLILAIPLGHSLYKLKTFPLILLPGGLVVAAAIAFQPLVQILVKVPAFQEGILNQRGLVDELPVGILLALVVLISIFVLLHANIKRFFIPYISGIVAFAFSAGILFYQLHEVHEPRYYYFKSLYTVVVLMVPLAAAALAFSLQQIASSVSKKKIVLVGGLAVIACLMVSFAMQPPFLTGLLKGTLQGINPGQAQAISDIITNKPEDASHITSVGSCNRGDDIRAAQFASSLSYQPAKQDMLYSAYELSFINKDYLFKSMREFMLRENFYLIIIVNDQVIGEDLKNNLGDAAPLAHFVILDSTPETEPVRQCPDRIRSLTPEDIKAGLL